MIGAVLDNSAAVLLSMEAMLLGDETQYYAPELIDLEFANAFRKLVLRGALGPNVAGDHLSEWSANALIRCSHAMLLPRVWELRDNITPYDAAYVALAEILGVPLVTADRRLARTASSYCEVVTLGD